MSTAAASTPGTRRKGRGARERITAAASELFYRRGIHATGVDTLIAQAEVSKRTFYQHFPSKNALIETYLRDVEERGGSPMERRLQLDLAPRERLLTIFDAAAVKRFRGCPFHNAVVELAGEVEAVDDIVRDHKQRFSEQLAAVAGDAGAVDPWQLAQQLLVLFEGATALATTLNDLSPMVHARAAAANLIDLGCRPADEDGVPQPAAAPTS
ncbi:TetR/AcrR family transcriptional regulator [Mycobacterium sp. NAZ190054]|uniref:TetR/AcrR family transcriptional regulator n=1 Tax=Mycobacterium sp. NAZ190054 TaxID=1747766 RepID=UPI000793BB1E|nr:TetR/AcrR family transcriptional regulator [Mycobacterium sp. NAZ190054]KWX68518.1 TetR family transcriptional regulator [Mycobacterium sp. NAZ190054]